MEHDEQIALAIAGILTLGLTLFLMLDKLLATLS
jgi:hypothetical protein